MSIFATIENREKELFVLNNGPLNSPITLVKRMPTVGHIYCIYSPFAGWLTELQLLEFIPGPRPIAGVAKIKGANDLYINVGPVVCLPFRLTIKSMFSNS
jgi:hypothetical protein